MSDGLLDGEAHVVGVGGVAHGEEGVGPTRLLQQAPRDHAVIGVLEDLAGEAGGAARVCQEHGIVLRPEDGSVTADVIPDVPVDPLIRKGLLVLPVVPDTRLPAVQELNV